MEETTRTMRPATVAEAEAVVQLIRERIAWMDREGLHHWNMFDYLDIYPQSYFEELAALGELYVLEQDGEIVAAAALLEQDARWDAAQQADYYYVHHLVAKKNCPGAGTALLRFAEALGRQRGKRGIRMDSAVDSTALSRYYEKQGYFAVSTFIEGDYNGVRRVKYLDVDAAFRRATAADLEALWQIEQECFPPHEQCLRENFERRVALWPEHFLLLEDRRSGEICGFLGDVYANAAAWDDAMFGAAVQHAPEGKNLMVLGLNVRPAWRGRGFAAMLMRRCIAEAKEQGLERCCLTCHARLIPYYESFGYVCAGVSQSTWGGETWYDMVCSLV